MLRRIARFVLVLPLALGALEMLAAAGADAQEASPRTSPAATRRASSTKAALTWSMTPVSWKRAT